MGHRRERLVASALAVLALCAVAGLGGAAQDATPDATPAAEGGVAHPAHVHAGTCGELDPNPAFPLTDVTAVPPGEPASAPEGALTAIPVEQSVTELEVSLADLLADPHAINVHESSDNIERYIACGDIGGAVYPSAGGEGEVLAIGLREQNGSGYSGIAWLQGNADGGTTVSIFLARDLAEVAAAAGEADGDQTEDGDAATAEADEEDEVTIRIVDFAFEPVEETVEVGTTVTWVNDGPTDHTSTAYEGGDKIWDSAILAAGESFAYTFEEAGSFDYLCTLHPSMKAHIDVVE